MLNATVPHLSDIFPILEGLTLTIHADFSSFFSICTYQAVHKTGHDFAVNVLSSGNLNPLLGSATFYLALN